MRTHSFLLRKAILALVLLLSVAGTLGGCSRAAIAPSATSTSLLPSPTVLSTSSEGLKDINGTQLYYKTMGTGQPLFFIHGRSGSHRYFLPAMEPLAADHRVFFYDQRGTGSSDGHLDLKAVSIDQFVEDLEAMRVASGFENISLVGHSWGALIALAYAIKYQDHLNKLILLDPVPITRPFLLEQNHMLQQRFQGLTPQEQQTLRTVCSRSITELAAEAQTVCLQLDAKLRFYDPAKMAMMDTTIEKNTARNAATIESLLGTSLDRRQDTLEAQLKTITVPTLILHGDFDPIPVDSSASMQQRIPHAQLVMIKQSGHFSFVEQPAQVLTAMRAFLQP